MKHLFVLSSLLMSLPSNIIKAADTFTATTIEGVEMAFKVISESEKTAIVSSGLEGVPAIPVSTAGTVTIPQKVKGYRVNGIGEEAFRETSLSAVNIPVGISSIGEKAFAGCLNLSSVTLPEGMTFIGEEAFSESALSTILLPTSLVRIGEQAFEGTRLITITLPQNVAYLGNADRVDEETGELIVEDALFADLFNGCSALTEVNVDAANKVYASMNGILMTKDLKTLLYFPQAKTDNTIPAGVETIYCDAFADCTFSSITLPASITTIEEDAFDGCDLLSSIISKIMEPCAINRYAFSYTVYDQSTLYVPAGTKELYESTEGWNLFQNIVEREDEELHDGDTFTALTEEGVEVTYKVISVVDKTCQVGDGVENSSWGTVSIDKSTIGSITIPEVVNGYTVIAIGTCAYDNCESLVEVTMPSSIEVIRHDAFNSCVNLQKADIPSSVREIGYQAFVNCHKITSVNLPEGIKTIAYNTFAGTKLSELKIPNSVETINGSAFNGGDFTSVLIPYGVKQITSNPFMGCNKVTTVEVEDGNQNYHSDGNGLIETKTNKMISGFMSTSIPSYVKTIGEAAFCNIDIQTFIIPEGVTSIEYYAFGGCWELEEIEFPSTITNIDENVLNQCHKLVKVTSKIKRPFEVNFGELPSDVTLYVPAGTKAFYEATEGWNRFRSIVEMEGDGDDIITFADANVKTISVENWDTNGDGELSYEEAAAVTDLGQAFAWNSVITCFEELQYFTGLTSIGPTAFICCTSLFEIVIPENVTSIENAAFFGCTELASLIIPNSVQTISYAAFQNSGLISLTIPKSVTLLGSELFAGCNNLTALIVEEGNPTYDSRNNCNAIIETVSNKLLMGCKSSIIHKSVTEISEFAFRCCTELTDITIPDGVTRIEQYAFSGCSALKSIYVPKSVVRVSQGVFAGCSSLTSIIVEGGNPEYDSRMGCNAIIQTSTGVLITGCQSTAIPNGTSCLYNDAFNGCSRLISITIPQSVMEICDRAFLDCNDLESIDIPDGVVTIGNSAFSNCTSLKYVDIPGSVTFIDGYAFYGCKQLTEVRSMIQAPFAIDESVFSFYDGGSKYTTATLYVPYGTNALYEAAEWWNQFQNIVEMKPVDIEPLENGDVIDFSDFVDESGVEVLPALDGNVVGNLYFNILNDNGGYDAEEGCIVITESTADETIERIADKDFYDKELRETFTGIIFKVPAGSGNIKITAEALGAILLKVRIGDDEPQSFELDGRQKVKIPYTVSEETLVYIYAGKDAAVKGVRFVTASSGMLRIFGIESESIPTSITNVEAVDRVVTIYSVSGQRLSKPQKGVNIIGGKKVLVK